MFVFLKIKESPNFFFILLSIIMFFFCLYLYFTNRKLKERIAKLEKDTKEILERKLLKESPSDLVSIKNLSVSADVKEKKPTKTNQPTKKTTKTNYNYHYNHSTTYPKKTNNQKEGRSTNINIISKPVADYHPSKSTTAKLISPTVVSSPKKQPTIPQTHFNLDEFIRQDEKIAPSQKVTKMNQTPNYLEELSAQIADELGPQTIELTEYEKVQEEQAVISYQELLALKDKGELQAEEDENINFIEDLKQFRNNLH